MATVEVKKGKQKTRKEYVLRLTEDQVHLVKQAVWHASWVMNGAKGTQRQDPGVRGLYEKIDGRVGRADGLFSAHCHGVYAPVGLTYEGGSVEVLEVPEGAPEEDEVTIKLSGSEARELKRTVTRDPGSTEVFFALHDAGILSNDDR